MPHKRKTRQRNSKRQKMIRRGHRWIGYGSLFFVVILSITGLILNHTAKLNLNQQKVHGEVISSLYNLSPTTAPRHFRHGKLWLSWLEGRLYLDGIFLAANSEPPIGFARQDGLIIVGSRTHLSLYLTDGSVVETMDLSSLPGEITAFGQSATGAVVITTAGGNYTADSDFISWHRLPDDVVFIPDHARKAPEQITKKILQDFHGQGITLYRLILDLHSGRILGSFGPYLMDLAAISLVILGITGLIQRKRTTKDRKK